MLTEASATRRFIRYASTSGGIENVYNSAISKTQVTTIVRRKRTQRIPKKKEAGENTILVGVRVVGRERKREVIIVLKIRAIRVLRDFYYTGISRCARCLYPKKTRTCFLHRKIAFKSSDNFSTRFECTDIILVDSTRLYIHIYLIRNCA